MSIIDIEEVWYRQIVVFCYSYKNDSIFSENRLVNGCLRFCLGIKTHNYGETLKNKIWVINIKYERQTVNTK